MARLKGLDVPFCILRYRVTSNCRNDDYLWGVYMASRPSLLKKYKIYSVYDKSTQKYKDIVEYSFPIWWKNKIEEGFPER